MKVTVDGQTYLFHWRHTRGTPKGTHPRGGVTTCIMRHYAKDGLIDWVNEGESYCHTSDVYNKSVGRKKSLVRCIADRSFSFRQSVWNQYQMECK